MSEDELKVQIIVDGPDRFRAAFEDSKKATKGKQKKSASTNITAAQKKKAIKELHQSDEWQEYQMYRAENSQIWADETGKKEPGTVDACAEVNARIAARLEALAPPPGDDDIPM